MDDMRAKDWERLAQFVRARQVFLGLTQSDLAAKAGVSPGVITDLESGRSRGRYPHKLPLVEAALGWQPGSCANVLKGDDPIETGAPLALRPVSPQAKREMLDQLDASGLRTTIKNEFRDWLESLPEQR